MTDSNRLELQRNNTDGLTIVWEKFVNNDPVDTSVLRPEILAAWQRCRGIVNPRKGRNREILSPEELEQLWAKNKELIDIAVPVMENLYDFVRGSGFSINLAAVEKEALIFLEIMGDPEALTLHEKIKAVPGTNWAETVMGNTAVSMAYDLNRPFQVYPNESWCSGLQVSTNSAAPVHDPDFKGIIGVLLISGSNVKVHLHTLGMVVAAVDSIEKQIAVSRMARKAEIANQFKKAIMDSFADGIVALDEFGVITHVNQKGLQILRIGQNAIGQNIFRILDRTYGHFKYYRELGVIINSNESVYDRFINIQDAKGIVKCVVTTRCLHTHGQSLGKILIIQKFSRTAKLVSSAFGNYARFTFDDIIGQDPNFLYNVKLGIRVARTSSNVLLLGESGTGKDLFAQAIHNASSRRNQPYLAINCSAIPRDLLGSELFGYVEGAFTGAKKGGSPGKFELADGGTVFLDEIGDMPLDMQTSLLRVLEEKAVTRIGDKKAIPVDVRIIAATNKVLSTEVERGNFRKDLYYRIDVVSIELPPLRERMRDLPLLIDSFVKKLAERMGKIIENVDPDVYSICSLYDWPGNVRELQNVVDRGVNLAEGNTFDSGLLPKKLTSLLEASPSNQVTDKFKTLRKSAEQSVIQAQIETCNGNKSLLAKKLGISRSTLYRKLRD